MVRDPLPGDPTMNRSLTWVRTEGKGRYFTRHQAMTNGSGIIRVFTNYLSRVFVGSR